MSKRAIIATLMTLIMMPVLLRLGFWQWERLHWKEALIARIAASAKMEPVPFQTLDWSEIADKALFKRVIVKGRFDHDAEQRVWTTTDLGAGWRIITPFLVDASTGGGKTRCGRPITVLVNRGWVKDAMRSPDTRIAGQMSEPTVVTGRLRSGESSPFVGSAGSRLQEWTLADIDAMAATLAPDPVAVCANGSAQGDVASSDGVFPFFLEAEAAPNASAPQPDLAPINLSNRHLEYMITWLSFAFILMVIYGIFVWREFQPRSGPDKLSQSL